MILWHNLFHELYNFNSYNFRKLKMICSQIFGEHSPYQFYPKKIDLIYQFFCIKVFFQWFNWIAKDLFLLSFNIPSNRFVVSKALNVLEKKTFFVFFSARNKLEYFAGFFPCMYYTTIQVLQQQSAYCKRPMVKDWLGKTIVD